MIISDKQARLAAQDLKEHAETPLNCATGVSLELIVAARAVAIDAPDTRPERIRQAEDYLGAGEVDAHQVAEKMIARIVSDSLR